MNHPLGFLRHTLRRILILLPGLSAALLAGCLNQLDPDTLQPRAPDTTPPLYGQATLGQTFVAARPGLAAIQFQLATQDVPAPVIVRLTSAPDSNSTLRAQAIEVTSANLLWEFPPLADSQGRTYYVSIQAPRATVDHPLSLRSVAHEVYRPGNLFVNGIASPGDLTFSVYYDYDLALFLSDLGQAARNAWLIIPALALFGAPGFLLLRFSRLNLEQFDFWQKSALGLGTSLALMPVLLLWVTELGGAISATMLQVGVGSAALVCAAILGRAACRIFATPARLRKLAEGFRDNVAPLLLILGLGFGARLIASRDLVFPPAVDAIHNYILARLIADTGRVPATYAPDIPTADPTFHFGFHAVVAAFAGVSGLELGQALLFVAPAFNALMALQVYLLARWLTGRTRSAVIAALIVAVISTMPAYNINWGHDTELAGWLILPVALLVSIQAAQTRNWKIFLLAALVTSGLTVTHYRVFAFYLCFIAAEWLIAWAQQIRAWRARLGELVVLAAISIVGLSALMPWLWTVIAQLWFHALALSVTAPHHSFLSDFSWDYVTAGYDGYLLWWAVAGGVIALALQQRFVFVLLVWFAELLTLANLGLFGLPGQGMLDNMSVLTMGFIPIALGGGFLADEFINALFVLLPTRRHRVGAAGLVAAAALLVSLGLRQQMQMLKPQGILALAADRQALAWIEKNISPRGKFLINAQPWVPTIYAGTDGGSWIAPLTPHETTAPPVPPALYALREMPRGEQIQEFYQRVAALAHDSAGLWQWLRTEQIDYVYVGALGGALDPQLFLNAPGYRKIYDNQRVYIFQVIAP